MAGAPTLRDYPGRPVVEDRPRISIVTSVRNSEKTLNATMESIRLQQIGGLEYIVVDAGSTDRTLDIVKANSDIVTFWQSERDRGISDGFNKGVALSTGKYVTLLNADDWLSPGQLAAGLETLDRTGADFVFGDLVYHDDMGRQLYKVQGESAYARRIAHVMPALNHPTVIVRRSVYERLGLFDVSLRYAMDYELLLRFHRSGCVGVHDPRMVGHMSLAGASDTGSLPALREVRDSAIRHGYPRIPAYLLYGFRLAKDRLRRAIENIMPPAASVAVRGLFNRNLLKAK